MHERAFEILITRNIPQVFGDGFALIAQQLSIPGGRIDLLVSNGRLQFIVELKKGRATKNAIDQVASYVAHFTSVGAGYRGWLVAHQVPTDVTAYAAANDIRTTALSLEHCGALQRHAGLDDEALLGVRVEAGVIKGGGAMQSAKRQISFSEALSEMAPDARLLFRNISAVRGVEIVSGAMQSMIAFKGIKIGGLRRRNPVFYISSGLIVSPDDEKFLSRRGFSRKTKQQAGSSHEHVWYEIAAVHVDAMSEAIWHFTGRIDRLLALCDRR